MIRMVLLILLFGASFGPAWGEEAASMVVEPCDLPGVPPALAPRLTCGTVAVPRAYDSPASGTFRLAVVLIKTASPHKLDDPVVYITGGPGSPLTIKAALLASHEAGVVAPDRDLILVDQRGAGRSEPALCPGLAASQLAIFAAGADQRTLVGQWRDSFAACRREMDQRGLRPEWFGTQITAKDIDSVRQALGVERWNVYALSYGTAVATTMMALHPQSLRAVVLDSVFPPEPMPLTQQQTFDRALDRLFAACKRQAACDAAHPDLRAIYAEAMRGLDAAPLAVTLAPDLQPRVMTLRSEVFRLIVDRALYSRAGMASLPALIAAARDRNAASMADALSRAARAYAASSAGIVAAVECRDRPGWHDAKPSDGTPVSFYVPGMCEGWGPVGPPPLLASDPDVPVLLLSGAIDPITPPEFAAMASAALGPRARLVEFAEVGHGAQQATPCGESIVSSFIRDPAKLVDARCAPSIAPVTYR